ncbi:MAG: tRNA pseudouridine(55) synthase TruB [Deltaproteobacteria bacterium]|nr:tRNA pseudouridine(55) synthase TruB [Deltaproteobacteria bacterium]
MNGFLIIDKPSGLTSHDVVAQVRRLIGVRRIGHLGTLDPLATGVLPLAVGQATRLAEFLSTVEKGYAATLKLGEETDTQDSEGRVLASATIPPLNRERIDEVFRSFVGTLAQVPPMFSAVKKGGTPLYRLARKGLEVERAARPVTIHDLIIIDVDLPFIRFEVVCSKGTYVRTLCRDLGLALGSLAHMTCLRRTRCGLFTLENSVSLDDLKRQAACGKVALLPLEMGLREFSRLEVTPEGEDRLGFGIPPLLSHLEGPVSCGEGEIVALMKGARLLAVARFAPLRHLEKRGDFELLKVFGLP